MMKPKKRARTITVIIVAAIVIAIASSAMFADAIWSSDDAVHIDPDEIENSTLAIGTHLIHLSALTQPLYDIAEQSAEDSGQDTMYYKSELADGTWFDISTASSLADITTGGTPVDKSVIAELYFTYHTKSDGKTYDLRTNAVVDIFNINDPYDLETMDELMPLKNQYDQIVQGQGKNDTAKRIEKILKADIKDDYTDDCDKKMDALSAYNKVLADNDGGANEQEAVQKVMESVDADRRAHILTQIESLLNDYLDELGTASSGDDEESSSQSGDSSLLSAVAECVKNVEESFTKYDGIKLSEGTTVYQSVYYKYANQLISDAGDDNHASCDTDIANLIFLENIMNNTIADKTEELSLLNSDLLSEATDRYVNAIKSGESADYKAQVESNAASALLNSTISANTSTLNSYRSELETFITAYCSRVGDDDAVTFLDSRIDLTKTWYADAPSDAFYDGASSTVDSHLDFLTKKKNSIKSSAGDDELSKLKAEKADLQEQMKSALDNNDLETAQDLEDRISDLDDQISDMENEASNNLAELESKVSDLEKQLEDAQNAGNTDLASKLQSELGDAKADLSDAAANMSDGSLGNQIELLKQDGLSVIDSDSPSDEDINTLNSDIDALIDLMDLSPKQVLAALTELYNEMASKKVLNSTDIFDDSMEKIEEAIKNNTDAYTAAMDSEKSAEQLQEIANNFLAGNTKGGGDLLDSGADNTGGGGSAGNSSGVILPQLSREDLMDEYGQEIFLLALQSYYDETGSDAALGLIASTSRNMANIGKQTVYLHLKNAEAEYIPLSAIHAYSGMRYVEKDGGMTATLAQGANYFTFKVYSDAVTIGKDSSDIEYMEQAAAYQSGIHICENYSYSKFGIRCVYLSDTQYAVICTDQLKDLSDELFGMFLS